MFTAMPHQGQFALIKLDRRRTLSTVTERDEYGNSTEHAYRVVGPSSRLMIQQEETYYLGDRNNEEILQTYLAEGETAEDTDNEDYEQPKVQEQESEKQLQLIEPLDIPELRHNSPIPARTPDTHTLPLLMPKLQEKTILSKTENDDFIREHFNFIPETINKNETTQRETERKLNLLSKGELNCKNIIVDTLKFINIGSFHYEKTLKLK